MYCVIPFNWNSRTEKISLGIEFSCLWVGGCCLWVKVWGKSPHDGSGQWGCHAWGKFICSWKCSIYWYRDYVIGIYEIVILF